MECKKLAEAWHRRTSLRVHETISKDGRLMIIYVLDAHIYTACESPGIGRCGPCDTQSGGKARMHTLLTLAKVPRSRICAKG